MDNQLSDKSLEASIQYLTLFEEELADPEVQLSYQSLDKSFTLFPLLPPEIRQRIWWATFPPPRIVDVQDNRREHTRCVMESRGSSTKSINKLSEASKPPPALHVNRESRATTLRVYQIIWPQELRKELHHLKPARRQTSNHYNIFNSSSTLPLWFDPDIDLLVFFSSDPKIFHLLFGESNQRRFERVKRIVVAKPPLNHSVLQNDFNSDALWDFNSSHLRRSGVHEGSPAWSHGWPFRNLETIYFVPPAMQLFAYSRKLYGRSRKRFAREFEKYAASMRRSPLHAKPKVVILQPQLVSRLLFEQIDCEGEYEDGELLRKQCPRH